MKKWGKGLPVTMAFCMMISLVIAPMDSNMNIVYGQTKETTRSQNNENKDRGSTENYNWPATAAAKEQPEKDNTESEYREDDKKTPDTGEVGNKNEKLGNGIVEDSDKDSEREDMKKDSGEKDSAEKDNAEKDSAEKDNAEKDSAEKDNAEKDNAEKGNTETENGEKDDAEEGEKKDGENNEKDDGTEESGAERGLEEENNPEIEPTEELPELNQDNQLKPQPLLAAGITKKSDLPAGTIEAGSEKTVAEAFEELTEEEVEEADGEIILYLTDDTKDGNEIFVPLDLGISHVTITSEDEVDYQIGTQKKTSLYANGIPLLLEHGTVNRLFGGGKNIPLDRTDLTITGGQFNNVPQSNNGVIVGGSYADKNGADISISGSCNITIEADNLQVSSIFGGNFTEASNITATVGETNLQIIGSEVEACMIAGGSFLWGNGKSDVNVDTGTTNLYFEDSRLLIGYLDWSFSIYGGNVGNDEINHSSLKCDSTNITVSGTEIEPQMGRGGELFGGSYNTSKDGSDEVSTGSIIINLIDSTVNGIFGGGYYSGECLAETGYIEINIDNCVLQDSTVVSIPIVCGGDIFDADEDNGETPVVEAVDIHLSGGVTDGASVYAEGLMVLGGQVSSVFPQESHLTVEENAFSCLDTLDYDSIWTDVTLMGAQGRTQIISEYTDFENLKAKIATALLIMQTESAAGEVKTDVTPEAMETPEIPDNVTISEEESAAKKAQAISDTIQSLQQIANKKKENTLNNALVDFGPAVKPGDKVSTLIQIELKKMELAAEVQNETEVIFLPKKMILEITPCIKVESAGNVTQSSIQNDQLSGEEIEFCIGVPLLVTNEYANVLHHAEDGEEAYQVKIRQDVHGKFIKLHARNFSEFEIEFVNDKEGHKPEEKPVDSLPAYHGNGSSDRSSYSQPGVWVQKDKRWYYYNPDGSMLHQQWAYLYYGNRYSWYYFDSNGMMAEGWLELNGENYFLHNRADGTRGHLYTGWNLIDEKWYYFEPASGKRQGLLYVNTTTPDGYTVGEDGSWNSQV